MVLLDIKPEPIVKPKTCACCKNLIDTTQLIYYGHTNYKSPVKDCCSYICIQCSEEMTGYIAPCTCGDLL